MVEIEEPSNARSRRTRAGLLEATHALLKEEGFDAVTMAGVAQRAGVSRAAAYLHFESRSDLVASLFDHLAGLNRLAESMAPVWAAPNAVIALEEWAHHLARYHPAMIAVDRAFQRVRDRDPDAGRHRELVSEAQLESARRLASWLAEDGQLAPGWTVDSASDLLYGLIATDLIDRLISDRGWPGDQLADGLALMLRRTFVGEGTSIG